MGIHRYSDLVYMVDLRYAPSLSWKMGSEMLILRDLHWESGQLVQKKEVR